MGDAPNATGEGFESPVSDSRLANTGGPKRPPVAPEMGSRPRPLDEVVRKLNETGFTVDQVFGEIGCIAGSAAENVITKLRSIPEVADVSTEEPIDIGPPDSPLT